MDGLMQDCSICNVLAKEILQSCTEQLISTFLNYPYSIFTLINCPHYTPKLLTVIRLTRTSRNSLIYDDRDVLMLEGDWQKCSHEPGSFLVLPQNPLDQMATLLSSSINCHCCHHRCWVGNISSWSWNHIRPLSTLSALVVSQKHIYKNILGQGTETENKKKTTSLWTFTPNDWLHTLLLYAVRFASICWWHVWEIMAFCFTGIQCSSVQLRPIWNLQTHFYVRQS